MPLALFGDVQNHPETLRELIRSLITDSWGKIALLMPCSISFKWIPTVYVCAPACVRMQVCVHVSPEAWSTLALALKFGNRSG